MNRSQSGLSLVELLVAISIIATLSTVLYVNFNSEVAKSRDAERRAALRGLQTALELYKNEHGRYPAGCNGPVGYSNTVTGWSGELGTDHACSDGRSDYIRGHQAGVSFTPDFLSALPTDPNPSTGDYGFVYGTNANGTVYKIMARNSVETEVVTRASDFRSCDTSGMCANVTANANNTPPHCTDGNAQFQSSYALWGGYANISPLATGADTQVENNTENIICRR